MIEDILKMTKYLYYIFNKNFEAYAELKYIISSVYEQNGGNE